MDEQNVLTSNSSQSAIENTFPFQSVLSTSDEGIYNENKKEKPKKILRKLKTVLRKEVKDELREELKKSKNFEDKVDRANMQFKVKVFETLKRASQRDQKVKLYMEHMRHERVHMKIIARYDKCRAKMIAEIERRKLHQETTEKELTQRKKNIEDRMKNYVRHWKYMNARKLYYREHIRKEMEMIRLCRKGLYVKKVEEYPCLKQEHLTPHPDPRVRRDMLSLVLHLIGRRVVHHAVSHVLCYLLTEAEQCILQISPRDIKKLNKSGFEICSDHAKNLLRGAAESYVPTLPPPGFLSNLLKICCYSLKHPSKVKSCPENLFKLKCPCEASTSKPELTKKSSESITSATPMKKENDVSPKQSASTYSMTSVWSTDSEDDDSEDDESEDEINFSPDVSNISQPTAEQELSSNSTCDSNVSIPVDRSIKYYLKKYNIRHNEECESTSNPNKYIIRNPEICPANSNDKAAGLQSDDSQISLCFQLKTKREPLTSNNLYELLHKEKSWNDDPCNSDLVVEKVKVPKEVNPVRLQQKLKPKTSKVFQPRGNKALRKPLRRSSVSSSSVSDILKSSEPKAGSIYWLYNSLHFLATKIRDLLCVLLATSRPPINLSLEQLEKFSKMEEFEDFLSALFEKNFDVINNDSLLFFIEKFFCFLWLTAHRCPTNMWVV